MENSTYVLLASNNWLPGSSSVAPVRSAPSSNSSHVVIAPRQSYATITSPADQNLDTRQSAGSQVPKNISVQRVPSNGNEIRLVVENKKDSHEPAAVGFTNGDSLRTGYTSIVGGNGVRIQIPTSGLTVSLPAVRKIAPASASPNVPGPNATRSHLVRGTSSANAKSGSTVNRMVWNDASSVSISGPKSQQASAVSPSKLIIQINPQQLSLITDMSQSTVQPNAERQPGAVSRLPGTQITGSRPGGSRVPPTHQPIQPKIVPGITAATSVTCSVVVASNQLRGAVQSNQSTRAGSSGGMSATTQRRILPATVQVQQQPILAATGLFQSLPGQSSGALSCQLTGGSLPQAGGSLVPAFAFVSQAGYNFVQTQAMVSGNHLPGPVMDLSDGRDSDEYSSSQRISGSSWGDMTHAGAMSAARPKKPCNCTKSQCLKLYCECFAGGEFCNDCNCTNCFNNLLHEDERARAIKTCRDRNPYAFHPKIGKGGDIRKHCKGCNCKRSGCLKNYCECYEAKIMCSNLCRCIGCKNIEESPDRQTLLHLANAAEVRVLQQVAAETKLSSHNIRPPVRPVPPPAGVERPAYMFINLDVIEAIASCLSEEGAKGEHEHRSDVAQERRLIEEFGRCLRQVIDSASRTRAPSPFEEC